MKRLITFAFTLCAILVSTRAAESLLTEQLDFTALRADCAYSPKYNQEGKYYMLLTYYGGEEGPLPQLQFHLLVSDTLRLSGDDTQLRAIEYYDAGGKGYKGLDGELTLEFDHFMSSEEGGHAVYITSFSATVKGENEDTYLIEGSYHGRIVLYYYGTRTTFIPIHEGPQGWQDILSEQETTVKTMRDGQLVILRNGLAYDAMGRRLQ